MIAAVEIFLKKKKEDTKGHSVHDCDLVTKLLELGLCSYNDGSVMSISLRPPPQ